MVLTDRIAGNPTFVVAFTVSPDIWSVEAGFWYFLLGLARIHRQCARVMDEGCKLYRCTDRSTFVIERNFQESVQERTMHYVDTLLVAVVVYNTSSSKVGQVCVLGIYLSEW